MLCGAWSLLLLGGCGPPKPGTFIDRGVAAYENQRYEEALRQFEKVLDTAPQTLNPVERPSEVAAYQECQIAYGSAQARQAEGAGRLINAWVWWVQVSMVSDDHPACEDAEKKAAEVRKRICARFLEEAEAALEDENFSMAMAHTAQSRWYGCEEGAERLLAEAAARSGMMVFLPPVDEIQAYDVADHVRTDSLCRLSERFPFNPYGIPIFFGDVPMYYVTIGHVRVEGPPLSHKLPPEYSEYDTMHKMTKIASENNADAIINVRLWTKTQKPYAKGEMIRFVHFP